MGQREQYAQDQLRRLIGRRDILRAAATLPFAGVLLSACGDSSSEDEAATESAAPSTEASASTSESASAAAEDFSGVTLQVWSGATVAGPAEQAAVAWQEATGGEVVVTPVPFAERGIKFAGLVSAQDASVDLLYASGDFVGRFGDRLYENLSDPQWNVDPSIFVPGTVPVLTAEEGLRGLPMHSEVQLFIYNKAMFDAAGIDPDSPPDNWAELYESAADLRDGTRHGCAVPWATSIGTGGYYLVFLNSLPDAQLLSDDRTQVLFGSDEGLAAFEAIEEGFKAGFFDPSFGPDVEDYATGQLFNDGATASMINFAELWGYAIGSSPEDFPTTLAPEDVGATILPGIESGTSGSSNGYEGFGLNRFGVQKEAAMSFLRYATGPEFQTQMNLEKTLPSSNSAVLDSEEVQAEYPIGPVIAEQGTYNVNRYAAPYDWQPPISESIRRLYIGEIAAAQAHEEAVAGVTQIVTEYLAN